VRRELLGPGEKNTITPPQPVDSRPWKPLLDFPSSSLYHMLFSLSGSPPCVFTIRGGVQNPLTGRGFSTALLHSDVILSPTLETRPSSSEQWRCEPRSCVAQPWFLSRLRSRIALLLNPLSIRSSEDWHLPAHPCGKCLCTTVVPFCFPPSPI